MRCKAKQEARKSCLGCGISFLAEDSMAVDIYISIIFQSKYISMPVGIF